MNAFTYAPTNKPKVRNASFFQPAPRPVSHQDVQRSPQQRGNPLFRSIPDGTISRTEFDRYLMDFFGVQNINTGTQTEQEASLTRHGGPAPSIPNWQSWDPGPSSADYAHIIRAIEDVAEVIGAVPTIRTVMFFKIDYEASTAGIGIARPDIGASFGGGTLTIFEAFSSARSFPNARSNASGSYPPAGVILGPAMGETPGAPRPYQAREHSLRENIVHEVGHAIAEDARRADPDIFTKFDRAVGWVGGQLFDIGQPAVADAISRGTPPPNVYHIQGDNWNSPQWIEQPMSRYAVEGGRSEDLAETITAYVYTRTVLQQRSPERYRFLTDHIAMWTTRMQIMPEPALRGDFPDIEEFRHMA